MTVLLLDDEKIVRDVTTAFLLKSGFVVIEAATSAEAIAKAAAHVGRLRLLITDHRLAEGMTGRDVAEEVRKNQPTLPVLYISGFPESTLRAEDSIAEDGFFYLHKPFMPQELVQAVTQILGNEVGTS